MQKLQIVTSYLLSYIFELARTANTQLICPYRSYAGGYLHAVWCDVQPLAK